MESMQLKGMCELEPIKVIREIREKGKSVYDWGENQQGFQASSFMGNMDFFLRKNDYKLWFPLIVNGEKKCLLGS